jgi:hypothetical protein
MCVGVDRMEDRKVSRTRFTKMSSLALVLGVAVLAVVGALGGPEAWAGAYFNSSEPGCDGSDPNVLWCDDFEHNQVGSTPGNWYPVNCDVANKNGGVDTQSKGWCGTIYADPITPSGAVDCTGVTPFGACAATSGPKTGAVGGGNMGSHNFAGFIEVPEVYVRWYYKPSVGYIWSGQKVLDFNRAGASGGIYWAGFGYNIGIGTPSSNPPAIQIAFGTGGYGTQCDPTARNPDICNQNQGNNLSVVGGHWYYYEIHLKLNTPGKKDGVYEFWGNDCGTTGTTCGSSPVLRARHTQADWGYNGSNGGIGSLWFENWANSGSGQGSTGTEWYDNIKLSRVGPIGFAGSSLNPPLSPTNLTVQP